MGQLVSFTASILFLAFGIQYGFLPQQDSRNTDSEPTLKYTSKAAIPKCLADFDGCNPSSVIYKTGVASYPYCDLLGFSHYRDFYYYCRRFQCLNGHYYQLDGVYYTSCTNGPTSGVPVSCPNNSCDPSPIR